MANSVELAPNLKVSRAGNKLSFEIDISKEVGASATGKSINVAKTEGPQGYMSLMLDGVEHKFRLQLYKPSGASGKREPVNL